MNEREWFDSVLRNKKAMGRISTELDLAEVLDDLERGKGMSTKVGDQLYKKYVKKWKL